MTRKACSQHAVGRGSTGMERLGHGAKHRFQPGRLGAGKTKRNGHLRLIESGRSLGIVSALILVRVIIAQSRHLFFCRTSAVESCFIT
jgi:hypothetical protein